MSLQVDVRKLGVFNKISKEGSQRVADSLSRMTGVDVETDVRPATAPSRGQTDG